MRTATISSASANARRDRPRLQRHRERDVRPQARVDVRRPGDGFERIDDRRERFVGDVDVLERIARRVRRRRDDDGDRLADEPHLVEREQVMRRRFEIRHLVRDRQRRGDAVRVVQVATRVGGEHAGLRAAAAVTSTAVIFACPWMLRTNAA